MRPERGFALVAALFLMVIVALVVATMSRLAVNQNADGDLALQQARAYQAAQAALEWGISKARNGSCMSSGIDLSASNLAEFSAGVDCRPVLSSSPYSYTDENGESLTLFTVTAWAENGSPDQRADYAYRKLTATVQKKP